MKGENVRRLSRLHRAVYSVTVGVVGGRLVHNDMLLLTTTGRRTGRPHTVPLLYLRKGQRLVVTASYGGRDHHPAWYLNLSADPVVKVQLRSRRFTALAATAGPQDRRTWWPRLVEAYEGYAMYQAKTHREFPVVFLAVIPANKRLPPTTI